MLYNNRERLLDSIPPAMLSTLLKAIIHRRPELLNDKSMWKMTVAFDQAQSRALMSKNKNQRKTVIEQHNGVMKSIYQYMTDELHNERKCIMVALEWIYALDAAGAISIEECGYGDAINKMDDVIAKYFDDNDPDGKLQKSVDKHVLKLHKLVNKFVEI